MDFKTGDGDRLDLSDFFSSQNASHQELFDNYVAIRSTSIGTVVSVYADGLDEAPKDVILLSNGASLDVDSFLF